MTTRTETALPPTAPPAPTSAAALRALRIGYGLAAVGAFLFATKGIAIKLAYAEGVDAATLLALRMAFSVPVYLVIGGISVRERRRTGRPLPSRGLVVRAALVGILGYWFSSYTDFLGLETVSAQFERLILFTYPLFVVLFGALFFRQKISRGIILAVLVSYAGLAVMFAGNLGDFGPGTAVGASWVLVAAVAFALYQLLAKGVIGAIGPRLFTCIAMSGAGAAALLQFFLTHPASDLLVTGSALGTSLYLAFGATVVPSFFMNAGLARISAQANAAIGTLSPVATIVLAYFILGETLSLTAMLGAALVIAGVGGYTLRAKA